jgi:hypothetical protein
MEAPSKDISIVVNSPQPQSCEKPEGEYFFAHGTFIDIAGQQSGSSPAQENRFPSGA